jgi:DNA-binding transcriptional LysR family regulator
VGHYAAILSAAANRLDRRHAAITLQAWEPPQPVSLVMPSARLLPSRVRAFLDFAAPRLAALAVVREG